MLPVKLYSFNVAAGGSYRLLVAGKYFKILSATGPVSVLSDFGTLAPMIAGYGLTDTAFSYLYITDLSGASNDVQIVVGDRNFVDSRITGQVVFAPLQATFSQAAPVVTNAAGGVQLLAAYASRKYLLIQNNNAAAGDIFVTLDGTAPTTANGIKIAAAGGSYELSMVVPSGVIKAIGNIANNPNVIVVES